jgi:hypothetical protein
LLHDRGMLDATAGGSLVNKGVVDGFKLIDDMALNQSQWHRPREVLVLFQKKVNEVESNDRLLTEIAVLNKNFDSLSVNVVKSNPSASPIPHFSPCTFCGRFDHLSVNCEMYVSNEGDFEQINVINQGNFRSNNNPYSNTYNLGWRNHPNFSWRQGDQPAQGNQGNQNFNRSNRSFGNQGYGSNQGASSSQPKFNIELMLEAFMTSQKKQIDELNTKVELLATQNKLLETQVAQQATQSARQPSTLPPRSDPN